MNHGRIGVARLVLVDAQRAVAVGVEPLNSFSTSTASGKPTLYSSNDNRPSWFVSNSLKLGQVLGQRGDRAAIPVRSDVAILAIFMAVSLIVAGLGLDDRHGTVFLHGIGIELGLSFCIACLGRRIFGLLDSGVRIFLAQLGPRVKAASRSPQSSKPSCSAAASSSARRSRLAFASSSCFLRSAFSRSSVSMRSAASLRASSAWLLASAKVASARKRPGEVAARKIAQDKNSSHDT